MPAYWMARSHINDPVQYKKYTDPLPALFARYGAKVLARGGRHRVMEGPHKFHRFVVVEFPTFEGAVACFTSPEYEAEPPTGAMAEARWRSPLWKGATPPPVRACGSNSKA